MAPATHPLVGQPAPTFTLPNSDGTEYTFQPGGRPVALFFYPKSGTYGCTKEACAFRDDSQKLDVYKTTKAEVVGVSSDDVNAQKRFVEEHTLPYPILSDKNGATRKLYQVPRSLMGLADGRTTFIIDKEGIIRDVYDSMMNFKQHVKFVETWLSKLDSEAAPTATATAVAPAPEPVVTAPATEPEPVAVS